mmetsp:Transcript_14807/g.13011  ORF Transcript_14807/g.13011 Transcript_14807/m.13011 type:complete len:111 (-) Transcript_14807:30-362(-)
MKVIVEFCGGMEILFGGETQVEIELEDETPLGLLITHLKDNHLKEREELFIHTSDKTSDEKDDTEENKMNTVRAGIIVMINDTDWELCDTIDYKIQDKDHISFISTLHGG